MAQSRATSQASFQSIPAEPGHLELLSSSNSSSSSSSRRRRRRSHSSNNDSGGRTQGL